MWVGPSTGSSRCARRLPTCVKSWRRRGNGPADHHDTTAVADALIIHGDVRLAQVPVNLLVNAAKFTNPGGCISISLERADAAFVIKVRDTGIGIGRDMLARVFDAYVRLDRGGGPGLGLGLALAMEIVQLTMARSPRTVKA